MKMTEPSTWAHSWRPLSTIVPSFLFFITRLPPAADALGGMMQDERLQYSDGSWHRAQRDRVPFEASCYFTYEGVLPQGCHYSDINATEYKDETTRSNQKSVLTQLYEEMDGPYWRANDNWPDGDPCWDFWFGITCDEHGHVIYIELVDNRLRGQIPRNLGQITSLLKVDLSSTEEVYMGHRNRDINRISGPFPSMKLATRLAEIEISGNFIDALPADLEENANTLRVLSASRNRIPAFPPNLRRFMFLHTLELDRNNIVQRLPKDIGSMMSLRVLSMSYNNLIGLIPESITRLRKIEVFDVSHNPNLRGEIPETIIADWLDNRYLAIMNTSMYGYVNSLCSDIPYCWRFMYDTHKDLTWATAEDVPDVVNITMKLAQQHSR